MLARRSHPVTLGHIPWWIASEELSHKLLESSGVIRIERVTRGL
jgi:hypothetical protein